MPISETAMIALVEENEEMRAKYAVLYDACDHARRSLKRADLPNADAQDIAASAALILRAAQDLCNDLNTAAQRKGYEVADAEVVAWADAAGGWWYLKPVDQVRWVAARIRASARDAKSLRAHGEAALKLNHAAAQSGLRLLKDQLEDA